MVPVKKCQYLAIDLQPWCRNQTVLFHHINVCLGYLNSAVSLDKPHVPLFSEQLHGFIETNTVVFIVGGGRVILTFVGYTVGTASFFKKIGYHLPCHIAFCYDSCYQQYIHYICMTCRWGAIYLVFVGEKNVQVTLSFFEDGGEHL